MTVAFKVRTLLRSSTCNYPFDDNEFSFESSLHIFVTIEFQQNEVSNADRDT